MIACYCCEEKAGAGVHIRAGRKWFSLRGTARWVFVVSILLTSSNLLADPVINLPGQCYCDAVAVEPPVHGEPVNINHLANEFASIYLDTLNPECQLKASSTLNRKVRALVDFDLAGGEVYHSRSGNRVSVFHDWLAGAAVAHIYTAALELFVNGYTLDFAALNYVAARFSRIPDTQDPYCGNIYNPCADDYSLTAAAHAWIGAYQYYVGGTDAQSEIAKSKQLIAKFFQPLKTSGSLCYQIVGSNPLRCDGNPAEVSRGLVRIVPLEHGQENPAYGYGLMSGLLKSAHPELSNASGLECGWGTLPIETKNSSYTWILTMLMDGLVQSQDIFGGGVRLNVMARGDNVAAVFENS
jgi:hypothetical protein